MIDPFTDGYHCGLINERECPYSVWDFRAALWMLGNFAGLDVHCALVEAVYLKDMNYD